MNSGVSGLLAVVLALCYSSNGAFSIISECGQHGTPTPTKTGCVCEPCWTGNDCSSKAQKSPHFKDTLVKVMLSSDQEEGSLVYAAKAIDSDHCPFEDKAECLCTAITYSIASGNDQSMFKIDTVTGDIMLNQQFSPINSLHEIEVWATDGDGNRGIMTVDVDSDETTGPVPDLRYLPEMGGDSSMEGQVPHHRQKRAVTLPTNATFSLVKYGANMNEAEMKVGTRIQFRLEIIFPSGATDMQVELFAPDTDEIVMMLCNVVVTKGDNLALTGSITPTMESQDNSIYKDRAIIDLGTVTNDGSDLGTNDPSKITVEYEAVMIESATTVNDQEYWVSAGAEFNNKADVWVGQASFTAKTVDDSSTFSAAPQFSLSGPTSLEIGTSALYSLDVHLPFPIIDIKLDVFASVNVSDVMSICGGKLISVSDSYSCSIGDLWNFQPELSADGNIKGSGRLHLDLGRPINKLAREITDLSQHTLSFKFMVKMHYDEAVVGNPYILGSSVLVGTNKIWAGQIQITAGAKTATTPTGTPTFTFTFPDGNELSDNDPVNVLLDVDVPLNSNDEYVMEVLAPFNYSQPVVQICTVSVVAVGDNIGCLSGGELEPELTRSEEVTVIPDQMRIELGKITNVGDWGTYHPNSTTPKNRFTLRLSFKGTNHSLATIGSEHAVIVGMFVASKKLTVGKLTLAIKADSGPHAITSQNTPSFTMSFLDGENTAFIGEPFKFLLDVTTARDTIYSPMNTEFIMTNRSGEPLAHICSVELHSAGRNTPCMVKGMVKILLEMVSSFDGNIKDRAILNQNALCNQEAVNDTKEDHVVIAVNAVLLEHPEYATNNKTWLSAGVMYSPANLWVGQLAIYAKTFGSPAASIIPHLGLAPANDTITHVPNGYSNVHMIRIKLAPSDTTSIRVQVKTLDNAVSVCEITFARAGEGYPCSTLLTGVKSVQSEEDAMYGIYKQTDFNIGMIGNTGTNTLQTNNDFDDNTLELALRTKMTIDSTLAPDNSEHKLEVILFYDPAPEKSVTGTVTLTTTSDIASVDALADVNATSSIGSISGTNDTLQNEDLDTIVPGESKRVVVYIDTEPGKTSHLMVKMTTPTAVADIMNVDYLGLWEAGSNLPCIKIKQTTATYVPRTGGGPNKDIGTLNLHFVCNTGAETSNSSANTLTVEGIIRLDRDANVNQGDTLEFHTSVNSDSQELYIFKHTLTVGDPMAFVDIYTINETEAGIEGVVNNGTNPITMTIGETITIPIIFTVPPYLTAKMAADIQMPVNTSAILTVNEVNFVASGRNVPDMPKYKDDYKIVKESKYNTSQVNKIDMDFGVITNHGMMHRRPDYIKWDDTLTVEVTLQMADHELATQGSKHQVGFGLDVSKFIYILEFDITVTRTGAEEIKFNVSSAVDDVNSTATRIEVDTMLAHEETSTREGLNTVLNLFLPPYVTHTSTIITSPHKEILSLEKDGNAITISLGNFFFTDVIWLTTTIEANSTYLVPPGVSGSDSILQFQVVADTYDQFNLTSDLDYLNFTTTTTAQSGSSCTPAALGMSSNSIADCQISASRDSVTVPTNGRHTIGSGWTPFVHSGLVREERYFQVYFGHKTVVNSVSLQQTGPAMANKITFRHSDDGLAWVENLVNQITVDHLLNDQVLTIPEPVASRYIRVMITDTSDNAQTGVYKFEFTGCAITSDGPADLCTGYTEPAPLSDFHSRSFLVAGSAIYVCDGRKKDLGIEQRCYSSTDDQNWIELDPRVGSMLGYDSDEPRVYAMSTDGQHYMSSEDGSVWETSISDHVNTAKTMLTFKPSKKVPLNGDAKLNVASPHADYTDGTYGATSASLKKNSGSWNNVFMWSTCC